jgi:hypothetical protein
MERTDEKAPKGACSMEQNQQVQAQIQVPPEVKKWNWGAFLLGGIWGLGNGVPIALLSFIPFFGFIMNIILGVKGSEWAWKKKRWESVEHFKRVQKIWAWWAAGIYAFFIVMAVAAGVNEAPNTTPVAGKPVAGSESNQASHSAPEKKTAKIGDTVKAGELEYTILGVESKKEIKDPLGSVYKPGAGQYLVVEVQVKNNGKDKYTIDTSLFVLKDKEGAEYSPDPMADTWVNGTGGDALGFFLKPVNPHAVKKGKVVFDVPNVPAESFTFVGKGGFLSNDSAAIQLKK